MVRRMRSEHMNELSDHKPKKVVICVERKRWGAMNGERKWRIKWKVLHDLEKKEEYKESARVKWNERMKRLGRVAECTGRTWWKRCVV